MCKGTLLGNDFKAANRVCTFFHIAIVLLLHCKSLQQGSRVPHGKRLLPHRQRQAHSTRTRRQQEDGGGRVSLEQVESLLTFLDRDGRTDDAGLKVLRCQLGSENLERLLELGEYETLAGAA